MKFIKSILPAGLMALILSASAFAQAPGSVAGQVVDSLGAVVVGATVTAVAADGKRKAATSNGRGEYTINGLAPGKYTVKAIAPKFALYENADITIVAGAKTDLIVTLTVGGVEANVDVSNENKVSTDAEANLSA